MRKKSTNVARARHVAIQPTIVALGLGLVLGLGLASHAAAQDREITDANKVGKINWSDDQAGTEVNSLSQPTRFSQRSSIPQTRTGNESLFQSEPTRERGGLVPDRLNTFTNRSEPIVR